jgi:signal transduction histidine kinase
MHWDWTVYSAMYILTATVALVAGRINWMRRERRGVRSLALAMLFMAIWSIAGVLETAAVELAGKEFWIVLENLAAGILINFILFFAVEFYGLRILTPFRRGILWAIVGASFLMEATNKWHHLAWTELVYSPAGNNVAFTRPGLGNIIENVYCTALVAFVIILLIRQAVQSHGWERARDVRMIVSLIAPTAAFLVYDWNRQAGVDLLPIGAALTGLFITEIVFEDLHRQVLARTLELQAAVDSLQAGIARRQRLEEELRRSQDSLALRLAEQSQKLAGLYDLILLSGHALDHDELVQRAMLKIRTVLECEAACYYTVGGVRMLLNAQSGVASDRMVPASLPDGWLPEGHDVRADIEVGRSIDLPEEISSSGFQACLSKWLYRREGLAGILIALWHEPRRVSVEEIALFGAFTDALGVILENAGLRQEAAASAAYEERRRLARDLHDSVTQSLHSLVITAETTHEVMHTRPEKMELLLSHLVASARQALKEMRLLLFELRLASTDDMSLPDLIQARLDAVERRAGIDARLALECRENWPKAWESDLFAIIVEALNNALKHAQAHHVKVQINCSQDGLTILVSDDGCGFDETIVPQGGMGLTNMEERAERLGGVLRLQSHPGLGTQVSLRIPLEETYLAYQGSQASCESP